MSLHLKLHTLILAPVFLLFLITSSALYIADSYVFLSINILAFVLVVTITLPFLGSFCDKLQKNLKELSDEVETVNYSAGILAQESASQNVDAIESIYADLKLVMVSCCHKAETAGVESKGYLAIARDLGRICGEMGPLTKGMEELNTHNENLTYFTSDCIMKNASKMNSQILDLGIHLEKKKSKSSGPSLRRALAFRSLAQE